MPYTVLSTHCLFKYLILRVEKDNLSRSETLFYGKRKHTKRSITFPE